MRSQYGLTIPSDPRQQRSRWVKVLLATLMAVTPFASYAEPETHTSLIEEARAALRKDDGIDAEAKLRLALVRGASRERVAAFMGAALVRQGDLEGARKWLTQITFSPDTAAEGFRVLAMLEQSEGRLQAAGRAYDRALTVTPNDAGLWVEIGRFRYRGGQHMLAIEASDRAFALDPKNVRALEFRGELIRDRQGLRDGLEWFEEALGHDPNDISVLTQYAATLGELDRGTEMLIASRRLLQLDAGNPQAFYLQAALAARAGDYEMARKLLGKTRGKLEGVSGAIVLEAVLELAAGNPKTASEFCEKLLQLQPNNTAAKHLLARALYLGEQYHYLTLRFRDEIAREEASPYLLTVIARGYEAIGDRLKAGELLDRARLPQPDGVRILPKGSRVGELMAQGLSQDALTAAEQDRLSLSGSYDAKSLAGDVQLALGKPTKAQAHYLAASRIRMTDSLLQRRFIAYLTAKDLEGATKMVGEYLAKTPVSRPALRLQAGLSLRMGDPQRSGAILDYLRQTGSGSDVQLLADLAFIRLGTGLPELGEEAAMQAYRLQPSSAMAAQALAQSYAHLGIRREDALSLLDKAEQIWGKNELTSETRDQLKQKSHN